MYTIPLLPGRRTGFPVQPNDPKPAGLQWEPRATPHVSDSNGNIPAPASSDELHHGDYGSANASPIWLPACYRSPPSSTSTATTIPAGHAGPAPATRLHAAATTTTTGNLAQGVREMECLNCGAYWDCQYQVLPSRYCCVPLCSYCLNLLVFRSKCRTTLLVSIPAQASSTGYPSQCLTRCLILPSAHKPYLNPHSRQVSTLSSGVLTLGVNWPW